MTPKHACIVSVCAATLFGMMHAVVGAPDRVATFDDEKALSDWQTKGEVAVDTARNHADGEGGALKLAPGSQAIWKLRDGVGAGTVTMWIYDDGTRPDKPKARRAGPQWGVMDTNGRLLAMGMTYAPYLGGGKTYCAAEYVPAKNEEPWFGLQYVGQRRKEGWTKWTFAFDSEKGAEIFRDGREVGRYDWSKSQVKGFQRVALLGDAGKGPGQTLWVDDISVTLGGEMEISPRTLIVPEEDPELKGKAAEIVPGLRGKHPRLLFSAEDVDKLRAFAETPAAKPFLDTLKKYLPPSRPPKEPTFLTDATDAQRHGLWRMPTVALHYVLTGSQRSFERTVGYMKLLLSLPHWEKHEVDNGMAAANIMIGAGLAYDWLYHDLDPEFREEFRRKIWYHARAMYHAGHLMKDTSGHYYWEMDTQNNHRWHRNAGFALCTLAAYTGADNQKWLLTKLKEELDYVTRWLPDDGTSHESPTYMLFGGVQLMLAHIAGDRCFGTENLKTPFFRNLNAFLNQTLTPGLTHRFAYGDQGGVDLKVLRQEVIQLKLAAMFRQENHLAVIDRLVAKHGIGSTVAWEGLLWYDPTLTGGSVSALPTSKFFPDLGLLFVREGWGEGDVAAMFKCGPLGGYTLNEFRAKNGMVHINVAHDDPDAGSFTIFCDGRFVAETDRYSKHKQSANHNTILINGRGQMPVGRGEGRGWSQPGREDMSEMAVVTARKQEGDDMTAVEGEISGSYLANKNRPALDRFRRAFVWVKGKYILVLDDIRAPEPVDIAWLMQGPTLTALDKAPGKYALANENAVCEFTVAATQETAAEIVTSPADHRGKKIGWEQLRLTSNTKHIRLASVYDPWHRGLKMDIEPDGPDAVSVTITGDDVTDTWTWEAQDGEFQPYVLTGTSGGAQVFVMDQPDEATAELRKAVKSMGFPANTRRMKVSASSHEESKWGNFKPVNTVDGDLSGKSSWRAEGDGEWIEYALNNAQPLTGIRIAFVQGDQRTYDFEIRVSEDKKNWKTVFKGTSGGKTTGYEFFDFPESPARYVRVVGYGGSKKKFADWINITEVNLRVAR